MTTPADFSVADVLAWARTKPAGEEYDFYDADVCAIAQFGEATGREYLVGVGDVDGCEALSRDLRDALVDDDDGGWTFGGLVTRLEKLVHETPLTPSEWTKLDAYLTEQVSA